MKVNIITHFMFNNYHDLVGCLENSVDPNKLASSGSTMFSKGFISGFILYLKEFNTCLLHA